MLSLKRSGSEVYYSSQNVREIECLKKSLSIFQEGSEFSSLYQEGKWDGYVRFYDKKLGCFPLGMLGMVENALQVNKIGYQLINLKQPFVPSLSFQESLYEHQKEALKKFFEYRHGIIEVPTRGGKTIMAAEAIRIISHDQAGLITLFIVDSILLFEQALDDISSYLKISRKKIGFIKEGDINIEEITVGTIQSLLSILNAEKRIKNQQLKDKTRMPVDKLKMKLKIARKDIQLLREYLNIVDFLIVDECHEYGNIKRRDFIKKIRYANFRLFMSATPLKSENQMANLTLKTVSGLLLYKIHENVLKEKGILAKDKVLLILVDHNKNKNINVDDRSTYADYLKETITHNKHRNSIIVNITNLCRRLMLKTLVLFVYKEHGNYIQSIMGDIFLTGNDDLKYRQSVKNSFLRKKGGILLASNIFNKGITLPEVQILFNAGGGLEQSNIIQKKGRVLGVKGAKNKALIVDIIDDYQYFSDHSLSRIKTYEETVGIENIEVFDADDSEFYIDVQEFLKNWFQL